MSLEKNLHEDGAIVVGQAQGFPWPYTNVAAWQSADFYTVLGLNGLEVATKAGLKPDGENHFGEDASVAFANLFYKLDRQADADAAAALFADPEKIANPRARLVRVYSAVKNDIIPVSNFDSVFIVSKAVFGGRGDWQPFALITLPSIVWAYAKFYNWDVPDISFTELSDPKNINLRKDEVDMVWDRLLQQRVDLWKALGEENYKCQTPMGSVNKKTGQAIIGATTSDKLSKALNFAQLRWTDVYAAMGVVGNPNGKGRIPVANKFFEDRATAEQFVAERSARSDGDSDAGVATLTNNDQWAGLYVVDGLTSQDMAEAVAANLAELSAELDAAVTPIMKTKIENKIKAKFTADFGVDADTGQVFAWLTKLKEVGII